MTSMRRYEYMYLYFFTNYERFSASGENMLALCLSGTLDPVLIKIIKQDNKKINHIILFFEPLENQGPVVQSIVSLTSSLRGQLVKCFATL